MPSKPLRTSLRVRILTATISALVSLALIGIIWGPCTADHRSLPLNATASPADTPTAPPSDPVTYTWTSSPQELDVLETVFRYQLARNESSGTATGRATHYFLALGVHSVRQDPPAQLMSRFESHHPAIVPFTLADTSGLGVTHKGQGGDGVLLHIDRIRPIDVDTFDVDGGYYEASRSASGNTYRVRRRGDRWEVVGDAMWWIS
jgi:hypothetical protein